MKTRIAVICALAIALLSFTIISKSNKQDAAAAKAKTTTGSTQKGLAMEDKNQFN